MAVRESAGFKQLVGTARDQVVDLLCELEKWVASGRSPRGCPIRSHGSRSPLGLRLRHDGLDGYVRTKLLRDFAANRLISSGLSRDFAADRLMSSDLSQQQSIK